MSGVGTDGTIMGVAEVLRARRPFFRASAIEPAALPLLSGGEPNFHAIQGIGASFIPDATNREILDEIIQLTDDDAFATACQLAWEEGLMVGMSSGAAAWAALQIAQRRKNAGMLVVFIAPSATSARRCSSIRPPRTAPTIPTRGKQGKRVAGEGHLRAC